MIELNLERKLDISKLAKGDYLSLDILREVTGLDPSENVDLYRLAVLKIRGQIEDKLKFTTRADGYAIRILTDAEAVYQNEKARDQGIRKMSRAYGRATAIDENNLDEFTQEKHRQALLTHSRVLGAVTVTLKQIRSDCVGVKPPRNHSDSKIKILTVGENTNGIEASQRNPHRNSTADLSQRIDGESAAPLVQANERTDQQAEQDRL